MWLGGGHRATGCGGREGAHRARSTVTADNGAVTLLRVPDDQGRQLDDSVPVMPDDDVDAALRLMMFGRLFDRKAFSLQRQGRFGTYSPVEGQEASGVGAASALDPSRNWVVPQYRELPALLRQGLPLENYILYHTGHPAGGGPPEGVATCCRSRLTGGAATACRRPRLGTASARQRRRGPRLRR